MRAQINIAAYTPDNKTLVIASGKCNNAEEFKPFAVTLDPWTMSYAVDESISDEDIETWLEEMGAATGIKKKEKKKSPDEIKKMILELVPEIGETVPKSEVQAEVRAKGISRDDARDYIKILLRERRLFEHTIPREDGQRGRPETHLSRCEQTDS